MKTSQKGFIGIIVIIIIALAVGAGVTYYATISDKSDGLAVNPDPMTESRSGAVSYPQQSTTPLVQSQDDERKQDQGPSTEVKVTVTNTSEMGFIIKSPQGWSAMDEMAGHYTISQTEATGWRQGSNLEISIVKTDTRSPMEPGFTYCGDELMKVAIEKVSTDLVRRCNGSVMLGTVWHNGYLFVGKSTQTSGNHDADIKIFADIVSSFVLKK